MKLELLFSKKCRYRASSYFVIINNLVKVLLSISLSLSFFISLSFSLSPLSFYLSPHHLSPPLLSPPSISLSLSVCLCLCLSLSLAQIFFLSVSITSLSSSPLLRSSSINLPFLNTSFLRFCSVRLLPCFFFSQICFCLPVSSIFHYIVVLVITFCWVNRRTSVSVFCPDVAENCYTYPSVAC